MLLEGDKIDRYIVEGILGNGATASVYRVRHAELNTQHALKLLVLMNPHIAERMLQEGRIQAQLRHPNVVMVTDMVRSDGHMALVMDYVEGVSLGALSDSRRLTPPQIDFIARGLFDGLEAAHEAGLVHRDLKPDNVMMQFGDRKLIPRITDFGLAKARQDSMRAVKATQTGTVMGTPLYMAPEQYVDAAAVDARADIYSLGAILYELVTGKLLYDEPDFNKLVGMVKRGDWVPLRELVPDLDPNWEAAIHACLAIPLEDRAVTVAAVRALWLPKRGASAWTDEDLEDLHSLKQQEHQALNMAMSKAIVQRAPTQTLVGPTPTPEPPSRRVMAAGLGLGAILGAVLGSLFVFVLVGSLAYRTLDWGAPEGTIRVEPRSEPTLAAPEPTAPPETDRSTATEEPAPEPAPKPAPTGSSMPEPGPTAVTVVPLERPAAVVVEPKKPPVPARDPTLASVSLPDQLDGYLIGGDSTRRPLASAPPDTYVLYVFFDNQVATKAGSIVLGPGENRKLRCDTNLRVCK